MYEDGNFVGNLRKIARSAEMTSVKDDVTMDTRVLRESEGDSGSEFTQKYYFGSQTDDGASVAASSAYTRTKTPRRSRTTARTTYATTVATGHGGSDSAFMVAVIDGRGIASEVGIAAIHTQNGEIVLSQACMRTVC
jgi:hypothetical protein